MKDAGFPAGDAGGLVLSRPDQHLAWHGKPVPADPLALIDRARGAAIPVGTDA